MAVQKRIRRLATPVSFLLALILQSLLPAISANAQSVSLDSQRQGLGSLNSAGQVFVNESPAPSELTIYSGDSVRTGESSSAMLTTTGNTSFQISPQSQVAFTGDARYFAELKSGTITVKSLGGAAGAVVRAGNFVVVPTNRNERTIATIEKMADGSYLVSCAEGNLGIVPMQQASGLFLQAGRSARISPAGELVAVEAPAPGTAKPTGTSHRLWIYLGLAGGGIAAGVAAAIATEGNHPPISPSSP